MKVCFFDEEFIFHNKFLESKFYLNDLSPEEQDKIYTNFYNSYTKSVGSAWDRSYFDSKAGGNRWVFFGSVDGGIALRKQNSNLWKMNACYGSLREIMNAYKEMMSSIGKEPIWSAVTEEIADMLERLSKGEFKRAPLNVIEKVFPFIAKVYGGELKLNSDGSCDAYTPSGKKIKKYLIGNTVYYNFLSLFDK